MKQSSVFEVGKHPPMPPFEQEDAKLRRFNAAYSMGWAAAMCGVDYGLIPGPEGEQFKLGYEHGLMRRLTSEE